MALRLVSREILPSFLQIKKFFPQAAFTSSNSDGGNSYSNRGTWYKKDSFYGRVDLPKSEKRTKKGARRPRKVRDFTDKEIALIQEQQSDSGHFRSTRDKHERYPMSTAPVGRNPHPKNPWLDEEEKWKNEALQKSKEDAPVFESYYDEDPYKCEDKRCILCPKRYLVDIRPSWRNPKLLAQFVSPHTGLVYDKHITGLCDSMQLIVKKEVGKAQSTGYLATKTKEVIYLKDPPLFDPTRPTRKNPY